MMRVASRFTRSLEVAHFVLRIRNTCMGCDILTANLKIGSLVPANIDFAGSCQSLVPKKTVQRLLINKHERHCHDH